MTQVIIGYFGGDGGGVTPPNPSTVVGSFNAHNDTSFRARRVQQFTVPLAQGAVAVGDHLWTEEGEYIQWEPLQSEEGSPNLYGDGSPKIIKCLAKVLANSRQKKTLDVELDNARAVPAFVEHPNVSAALGNLLTRTGNQPHNGTFNLAVTLNGQTHSLRQATKSVVPGPVMTMVRIKERDPDDDNLFHEWWIKVYSGLPMLDAIVWTNVSNVANAEPKITISSHNFVVQHGEAVWKGNTNLWDAQSPFSYASTSYRPYVNNVVISEGQPLVRCRGQVFFYDPVDPTATLTTEEQNTLQSCREEGSVTGCFRSTGRGWKGLDLWGPSKIVLDRPVWMSSDEQAYQFAVQEAQIYYPGGEGLSLLQRHHLARGRLSSNYRPAATGWAPGFGILNFQAVAYTSCPLYTFGMESATDFEAGRPIFLRQANGDFLKREDEPSMATWEGVPFSFNQMSTGGGTTGVQRTPSKIPSSASRANPLSNGDIFTLELFGHDEQHLVLTVPHHFILTGDEVAGRVMDHHRQSLRMHLNTPDFPDSVSGAGISPVFGEPFNPRGEGRSLGSCAWIEFASPDAAFRTSINNHVKEMLNAWDPGKGLYDKPHHHGQTYGNLFLQSEAGTKDMASWSIFGPTGLQLDHNQMLSWEDGMASKMLQWMEVSQDPAADAVLRRLFKTISYAQVRAWWFLQDPVQNAGNGSEDPGWHLIQAIKIESDFNTPAAADLPPKRPWFGSTAPAPNLNTGYEDTGVDRYEVDCPYTFCSGYPQSEFKIARDGLQIWNLNVVYFAYQEALREGNTAIADKARDILNVYKAGHNQGPTTGIVGGWWPEASPSIGIWLYNPDMTGDPLTQTL